MENKIIKTIVLSLSIIITYYNVEAQNLKKLKGKSFSKDVLASKLYTPKGNVCTLENVITKMEGKVVLINFWASWCGACHTEMKYLYDIKKEYNKDNVMFLFLSSDTEEQKWLKDLQKLKVKDNHYRIDKESKQKIKDFLKIKSIPRYVILDKKGNILDPKAEQPHKNKLKKSINIALDKR